MGVLIFGLGFMMCIWKEGKHITLMTHTLFCTKQTTTFSMIPSKPTNKYVQNGLHQSQYNHPKPQTPSTQVSFYEYYNYINYNGTAATKE